MPFRYGYAVQGMRKRTIKSGKAEIPLFLSCR